MSAPKQYSGSYNVFLDTLKQARSPEAGKDTAYVSLLQALEKDTQPVSLKSLAGKVSLPVTVLVKTIHDMTEQQLITVTPTDDDELVQLTATGHTVAKLELQQD